MTVVSWVKSGQWTCSLHLVLPIRKAPRVTSKCSLPRNLRITRRTEEEYLDGDVPLVEGEEDRMDGCQCDGLHNVGSSSTATSRHVTLRELNKCQVLAKLAVDALKSRDAPQIFKGNSSFIREMRTHELEMI